MNVKTNVSDLVDIQTISIDKDLTQRERIIEYVRQIKNPYHFKCGKFTITSHYVKGGLSLEECLQRISE